MEMTTATWKKSQRGVVRPRANPRAPKTATSTAAKSSQKKRAKANLRAPKKEILAAEEKAVRRSPPAERRGRWQVRRRVGDKNSQEGQARASAQRKRAGTVLVLKQFPASSVEDSAANREGAKHQAGDTVSSDSGGGESDVPARENPQRRPTRER